MTEKVPSKEPVGKVEILDLPKYGAVYGRFLLAGIAKTEEDVANIINPALPVEFNLSADTLDKRDYNPVFENLSHKERQDQWEDFKPSIVYRTAYDQWRVEFTGFMKNIKKDSNRELALKAILPDKDAATFVEADANALFQKFCGGKSDTHKFISQIIEHAVNNKINPTNLQTLLSDLEWIASGLFGKQTAEMVARLIELESALHNNPTQVIEIFNSNKQRINEPTDDEKKTLGLLRDSLPATEEEVVPTTQKIEEPVVPADVPQPVSVISDEGEVPAQSAPVIPEVIPDEEDDDELPVAPLGSKTPTIPVSSVPPEEAVNALEQKAKMAEETLEAANKVSFEAFNVYKKALLPYDGSKERLFKDTASGKEIWERLDASWVAQETARKDLEQARADLTLSSGVVQPATEQLSPEQQEIQEKFKAYFKTQESRVSQYVYKEIGPLLYNDKILAIFAEEWAKAIRNANTPREFTHVIILAGDVFQTPGLTHNLVEAFFAKNPELKDPNVFWIPQLLPEYDIVRNALADRLQEKGRSFLEDYDSASVLVDIKYTKGSIEEFIAELRRPRQLQDF